MTGEKLPDNRRDGVNRTPTQTACTDAHRVSQHILNRMTTFHHANSRGSRLHILVSQNGCHNTCHVSFLAAPGTDHKVLSHLPHQSFRHSLPRTQVLWRTMHFHPAKIHGRVADQHKSHLSHTQYQLTPRSKWKMHHRYWKFQTQNVQIFGYVYQNTNGPNHGPAWKTQSFLLSEICTVLWQDYHGKGNSGKFHWNTAWKIPNGDCFFCTPRKKDHSLSVHVNDIKLAGKKQNIDPMWKVLMKDVDLGEPTSFLDHVYLGCTQRECETSKDIVDSYRNMFEYKISARAKEKLPCSGKPDADIVSWSYDMDGHAKKCVERYCELAKKTTQQLYSSHNAMPRRPSIQRRGKWICWRIVKSMLSNGHEMFVLGTHWLTRHSMVSKQTGQEQSPNGLRACFKRLLRLISYIHYRSEFKQYCRVENTEQQCRLGLFQVSDVARDLEDCKSTSGRMLCIFGRHTFVPISWMCKKQTSVSHSSTEGLRMDGIPALDLWDFGCWSAAFFFQPTSEIQRKSAGKLAAWPSIKKTHQLSKRWLKFSTTILNYATSTMFLQTWSLLNSVRCCTLSKITKRWLRWSSRAEVQQWDTYHEPTVLRVIGYLTEETWTTKSKSNMLIPRTNLPTYWPRAISPVMKGIISSICSQHQHFQLCLLPRNDVEKDATRNRRRIVAKSNPTLNLVSQTAASSSTAPSSSASNRPGILGAPSQQGSNPIGKGAVKLTDGGSNQNDAASSSQVWRSVAKTNNSTRKLAAAGTNQDLSLQECARELAAENSEIIVDDDSKWPNNYHISRKSTRICDSNSNASQKTKWRTSMWIRWYGECLWLSLSKPPFILESIIWRMYVQPKISTVKQFDDVTKKLVKDQKEYPWPIGINVLGKGRLCWPTEQFDCQQRKPMYSTNQYCAWKNQWKFLLRTEG